MEFVMGFFSDSLSRVQPSATIAVTDKARALTLLSRHIGVPMERVVFFGDGGNDVEALRGVGLGIAMANGSDAAKVAAARTSRWEYTEDAVARELARLAADGAFGTDVRLGGAAL